MPPFVRSLVCCESPLSSKASSVVPRAQIAKCDYFQNLPDSLLLQVLEYLSPEDVSRNCALVNTQWRQVCSEEHLWQQYCNGYQLRAADALTCLGGWRGLFSAIFCTNLIASPFFERIDPFEADYRKERAPVSWEPRHRLSLDRLWSEGDTEDDFASFSNWAPEGGSVFCRGGGEGLKREMMPQSTCGASAPYAAPSTMSELPFRTPPGAAVVASSVGWALLQQHISLDSYTWDFLDSCPPLRLSAWYTGQEEADGVFRLQLLLRNEKKQVLHAWDSQALQVGKAGWKESINFIKDYPQGVRNMVVKVGGTALSGDGHCGAKFTNIGLHFVPSHQTIPSDGEHPSVPVLQNNLKVADFRGFESPLVVLR